MLCRTGKQGSDRADAPLQLTDKAERKGERDGESGDCPSGSAGNAASVRTFSMAAVGVRACACPGGAQRRHLYKDCDIILWTLYF